MLTPPHPQTATHSSVHPSPNTLTPLLPSTTTTPYHHTPLLPTPQPHPHLRSHHSAPPLPHTHTLYRSYPHRQPRLTNTPPPHLTATSPADTDTSHYTYH
ncbi:hypothetical protein Pcinc_016463 [Petrolisthes cinctipes]|uniref:Uncharacterized protein n=1 Tax=Petrolisthes cinctipes TaxID=88211 RepID=A0AAE1KQZ2_PETCI|nr:hypothetical protein Pcinc_016463 [Petrolisthes cinctipes]